MTHWIQESKFELIESIVLLGTERLLSLFPRITDCRITVHKTAAIPEANAASVSWFRTRVP